MSVLGIELNHSPKNVGRTNVSNSYLCQVYDMVEYVRDNLSSALVQHREHNCTKCNDSLYESDKCDMIRTIIDAIEEMNDYLIDDDGGNDED